MRLARFFLVLGAIVLTPGSADAGKRAGVVMPDTINVADKQLRLNGMGLREATALKVDVYVAGLYLEDVSSNPAQIVESEQPKLLLLRFVRDVDREDIVKAWSDGFQGNATVPLASIQPMIDQLNTWMPRFRKGDTLAFTYVPGEGVAVEINHVRKGVIKDPDFARSLFSIWLGRNPPTGDLKRDLLGKHTQA